MDNAISINDMSVKVGGKNGKDILKNMHFELKSGEICAILGANGSGKSTLLRAILGLLPYQGSIQIFGHECQALSPLKRAKILSYVPQSQRIAFPFSLLEIVMMGAFSKSAFVYRASDVKKALAALELLQIAHLSSQKFATLSGGQQQLGLIARALVQDCPILLLDEPVSALDMSYSFRLLEILATLRDKTILITSHHPEQCFIADKIAMIKNATLLCYGAPQDVLCESRIEQLYGVAAQGVPLPNGGMYFCVKSGTEFAQPLEN